MARDYGSRKSVRRGNGMPQQIMVMVITFILGYFTASIFDIEKLSHWMTTQVLDSHEVKPQPNTPQVHKETASAKTKFEFYTLLANEKGVRANQAANARPGSQNSANPTAATAVTAAATTTGLANKLNQKTRPQVVPVKVVAAKPVIAPPPAAKGRFVVQVASFKTRNDAEHMKGLLTLKGFEVTVAAINTPTQGSWFRVVIGPYPNRVLAQKAQVILAKTERLNGMVRSV
jgi:cell division protein FtsN